MLDDCVTCVAKIKVYKSILSMQLYSFREYLYLHLKYTLDMSICILYFIFLEYLQLHLNTFPSI